MRPAHAIVLSALSAGLAFLAASHWASRPPAPPPPRAAVVAPIQVHPAPAVDMDAIRTALREERQAAAAAPPEKPAPADPEREAVRASARDRSMAVIAHARQDGRWSDAEASELHGLITQLDDRGRDEVLASIVPLLNSGELTLATTGHGPPF